MKYLVQHSVANVETAVPVVYNEAGFCRASAGCSVDGMNAAAEAVHADVPLRKRAGKVSGKMCMRSCSSNLQQTK